MAIQHTATLEDYYAFVSRPENADRLFELIDGEIVEVSPNVNHGLIASIIHGEIYLYLKQHPIGKVMFEVDHRLPEDERNLRRPDVSFIINARLQQLQPDSAASIMPDLAVEVKSPSNTMDGAYGLRRKAAYYLAHGSRLVWILNPEKQNAEVYGLNISPATLTIIDTLDGGDVLPGFALPVRDVFDIE